ncbi:hypothetical protein BVC93_26945 [Mycobacterium sp. MS1601]|nr:hypothetical protein BVC93_26945 [Mycobacterium sp. MS1601]
MSDLLDAANTEHVDVLRSLLQMSQAVLCARYFDEVLEAIAYHTLAVLDASSVSISRWEREENILRTLINVGKLGPGEEPWPENEFYPVDDNRQIMRLLRQGLPYVNAIDDEHTDSSSLLYSVEKESELAVPVMYNDVMWGELWVTGIDGRRFGADDVQVLQAIAAHMAVAVGRSQLFSTVWRQAFEDPLTGLANRRGLDQAFADMIVEDVRPALLVCDLDGFKEVNDRYGHPAGDALLRTVADALAATAAAITGSLVARLGGDEFCVVLPRSGLPDAESFAVTASRAIIELAGQQISVSWGAAVSGLLVADGPALIAAADAALLQSKRLGPGRFSTGIADDNPVPAAGVRRRGVAPGEVVTVDLVRHVTHLLDQYQPQTAAEALQLLAVQVCNVAGAAAWSLSVVTPDGLGVRAYRGVESTRDGVSGLRVLAAPEDTVYPLADYPATTQALATGIPFVAASDLPDCDPAEVALLDELGYHAVLGVTASDGTESFVLEIYSDTGHAELVAMQPHVRVLAQFCCASRRQA